MQVNTWAERTVLNQLTHPFVAKLEFAFQSKGKLFIGLEYFSGGDLHHHMHRPKSKSSGVQGTIATVVHGVGEPRGTGVHERCAPAAISKAGLRARRQEHAHHRDPASRGRRNERRALFCGGAPATRQEARLVLHMRWHADLKQRFIDSCSGVANADGKLSSEEFALIKGIAVTLGCPLPPVD